ncbi:MAG: LCP family protein [bacterium]
MSYAKKWLIPAIMAAVVIVCASALWLNGNLRSMENGHVTAANPHTVGGGYRNITYKGKEYRYNTRITAVLFVGLDSEGEIVPNRTFISAPNADGLWLVVMDSYHKKLTIMAINRNTMSTIHRYTRHGYDRGEFRDPVCLAYAYGESGEVSCKNLLNAVSGILYGIPIHEYVITNRASLPLLSRELGDVKVTVPNDDLLDYGYAKGDQIVVNADNIELFVRKRDIEQEGSHILRMERQRVFVNATLNQIIEMLEGDPTEVWKKVEAAENCVRTNITRSQYLDLCKQISGVAYDEGAYYSPEGVNKNTRFWAEFYPDEDKLLEKIVEIFYIPA